MGLRCWKEVTTMNDRTLKFILNAVSSAMVATVLIKIAAAYRYVQVFV